MFMSSVLSVIEGLFVWPLPLVLYSNIQTKPLAMSLYRMLLYPITIRALKVVTSYQPVVTHRSVPCAYRIPIFITLALAWPFKQQPKHEVPEDKEAIAEAVLKTADDLFESGQYNYCYDTLVTENEKGNRSVEIQWRICRVLYNIAKETKGDDNHKNELIHKAYDLINEELNKNDEHFAVQKWYALLLDAKSSSEGIKERIKQLENVKKHMDLAVTLNPNDATTLHMLGEWCFQITEMSWHHRKLAEIFYSKPPQSNYEDALEYFLQAEHVQPRFYSMNLLRIGVCYTKLKKKDQAKYYLKLAASYPAKSNEDHKVNLDAANLLKGLKYA